MNLSAPGRLGGAIWNRLARGIRRRQKAFDSVEDDAAIVLASGVFNSSWYLSQNPDVAAEGMSPVEHYLRHGWEEGRDPSPAFVTRAYLSAYPDVAAAGINPLVHFILHGKAEGRSAEASDYQLWIRRFDTWVSEDLAALGEQMRSFRLRPRISIIMPVYNTDVRWLRQAIDSVCAQIYPHWELCISDDASSLREVREVLEHYASEDPRVRLIFRPTNGHISCNSNTALTLATGEFIALLDADDELRPETLFWVAREINDHPTVNLIYSDEDKIDLNGRRYDPYFKPDWNAALIQSQNFFCHLGIYRRALVERVGGFREGYEGSQDHDLLLRCVDCVSLDSVRHIPRVLYHWRSTPGSTASTQAIDAKPYAWYAGLRSIEDHLERKGVKARVIPALTQYYQVDYRTDTREQPTVSVIMPSACNLQLLRPCLEALFSRTTYKNFEVLLAINEIRFRNPAQAAYLKSLSAVEHLRVLVYEDRPFNFSWINNWAIRQANGSVLCLMNDDVEVLTSPWLERLIVRLQLERVGAVGPMLYYPDNTIQHAGVILGMGGVAGHPFIHQRRGSNGYFGRAGLEQDVSCVTAACAAIRREAFDEVGGFNEALAIAFNDVDLCIRLRNAGWRVLFTPQVEHYHHESASLGRHNSPERQQEFTREVALMREIWGSTLEADPFYNPNLSLRNNEMTLAFPPRVAKI
jgi:GT2 family glycosyltransferase